MTSAMTFRSFQIATFAILFLVSVFAIDTVAQDDNNLTKGTIGVEVGLWKPSSIDDNPSKPFTNVKGADPYIGLNFTSPFFKDYAIRVTLLQWQQKELSNRIEWESVTLRHLSADLINSIFIGSTMPFVSFGLAIIWSREVPVGSEEKKAPLDRAGYGANVGAGIGLQLTGHIGVMAEYQYLYAKFAKKVGLTDNYSGPKLSLKFLYIF